MKALILTALSLAVSWGTAAADLRIGMIGLDTSHTIAFTQLLNRLFRQNVPYYNGVVLHRTDLIRGIEIETNGFAYQAEALIYQHMPIGALVGIACVNEAVAAQLRAQVAAAGADLKVAVTPGWYFS